jgi:hypothetical protein
LSFQQLNVIVFAENANLAEPMVFSNAQPPPRHPPP